MAKTIIIAEAGVNHNGSLDLAFELIDQAVAVGADIVKFQAFNSSQIVTQSLSKASYQKVNTGGQDSQLAMLKKLELSRADHERLIEHCQKKSIKYLSSVFDLQSLNDLVNYFGITEVKLGSGEITNGPLLLKIAQLQCDVILSTGMCDLVDIQRALSILAFGYLDRSEYPTRATFEAAFNSVEAQKILKEKVVLLHCTTAYPAPINDINLYAMDTMRNTFLLPVGYSDHSLGINIAIAAVARGAIMLEKHFTLDKNLPGPDHKASLDPREFARMVTAIREVEVALGNAEKKVTPSELDHFDIVRKHLVAAQTIKKGEKFTERNIAVKRSQGKISPIYFWEILGETADKDYVIDDVIS
ncbi:MAG: N-acetylneuraminate synthase [Pseudomonadota bacterium]